MCLLDVCSRLEHMEHLSHPIYWSIGHNTDVYGNHHDRVLKIKLHCRICYICKTIEHN